MAFSKPNSGMSLIEVVISLGVLGLSIMIIGTFYSSYTKLSASLDDRVELATVATSLRKTVDCGKTVSKLPSGVVSCTGMISLIDKSGKTLVWNTKGAEIGKWTMRARCDSSGIIVESAQLLSSGKIASIDPKQFKKDAATGKAFMWQNVYPSGGLCAEYFMSSATRPVTPLQGSFDAISPNHVAIIPTPFKPKAAICTTSTHTFAPSPSVGGSIQAYNCFCKPQETLMGPSWVRFVAHQSGPPLRCQINYMILGD